MDWGRAEGLCSVTGALVNKSGRRPQKLFTDMGKEYTSNQFKDFSENQI